RQSENCSTAVWKSARLAIDIFQQLRNFTRDNAMVGLDLGTIFLRLQLLGETTGWKENGEAIRRSQLRIATRHWVAEER
ncbi:hypothetical protein AB9F45_39210, partial [Rhizobium leguminosarum]